MSKRQSVQCSSATKAGPQCRKAAIIGAAVCKSHGGGAPQVRRKAAERVQAAKLDRAVAKYATPRDDVTPSGALVEELKRSAGFVSWLGDRLTSSAEPLGSVEWQRFSEERDRLTRLSVELSRLGIEASMITTQAAEIRTSEMQRALDFASRLIVVCLGQLGVRPVDRDVFATVLMQHMLAMAGDRQPRALPDELQVLLDEVTSAREARERELEDRVAELEAELVEARSRVVADGVRDRLAIGAGPHAGFVSGGDFVFGPDEPPEEVLEPDAVIDAPADPPRRMSVRQHFDQARRMPGYSGPRRL